MRTYEEIFDEQKTRYCKTFNITNLKKASKEIPLYLSERAHMEADLYKETEENISYEKQVQKKIRDLLPKLADVMTQSCREEQKELITFLEKCPEVIAAADSCFREADAVRRESHNMGNMFAYQVTKFLSPLEQDKQHKMEIVLSQSNSVAASAIIKKSSTVSYELEMVNLSCGEERTYMNHALYCAIGNCVTKIVKASKTNMTVSYQVAPLFFTVDASWNSDDLSFENNIKRASGDERNALPRLIVPEIKILFDFAESGIPTQKVETAGSLTEDDFAQKMLEGKNTDVIAEWMADKIDALLMELPMEAHNKFKELHFEYTVLERKVQLEVDLADEKVEENFAFEENHMSFLNGEVMCRGLAKALMTLVQLKLNNRHEFADIKYVQIGNKYKVTYQEMNMEYTGVSEWF